MSTEEYIQVHQDAVINDSKQSGIPASITMAQGILESRSGNSKLARLGNNHYGIKKHDWTGPVMKLDDDRPGELFRVYDNYEQSLADHSHFLKSEPRYKDLFKLSGNDYVAWANGLDKFHAGYATDPNYARELIEVIRDNKLYKLDAKVQLKKATNILSYVTLAILLAFLVVLLIKLRNK